jgi:hypothetical protein
MITGLGQVRLTGQICFATRVRARQSAGPRHRSAGPIRQHAGGVAGWATSGFRPNRLGKKENPISFSNMFSKFQTNLNSNQI